MCRLRLGLRATRLALPRRAAAALTLSLVRLPSASPCRAVGLAPLPGCGCSCGRRALPPGQRHRARQGGDGAGRCTPAAHPTPGGTPQTLARDPSSVAATKRENFGSNREARLTYLRLETRDFLKAAAGGGCLQHMQVLARLFVVAWWLSLAWLAFRWGHLGMFMWDVATFPQRSDPWVLSDAEFMALRPLEPGAHAGPRSAGLPEYARFPTVGVAPDWATQRASEGLAPLAVLLIGRWVVTGTWSWGPWARERAPRLPVLRPVRQSSWMSNSLGRWLLAGAIIGGVSTLFAVSFEEGGFGVGIPAGMGFALIAHRLWFGALVPFPVSAWRATRRLEKVRLSNIIT